MTPSASTNVARSRPADEARQIRALVASLRIGERAWFSSVKIQRTTLLTYDVAGFKLDLDEVVDEVVYLAAEREALQTEPSLPRAAEIVQILGRGQFRVGIERFVGCTPIWEATWTSHEWRPPDEQRAALDELAARARDMGIPAARLGYHVVSPMPLADRPPLARATHPQSRVSRRQPNRSAA